MRIVSVVGARPQFIKLAPISHAMARFEGLQHRVIHTGQHYDDAMSGAFFRDLEIPEATYNLGVGSGSHGEQTAEMIRRLEPLLETERPDWVLLYGDTNSTVAGALTAAKLQLRLAHIEAGLRSFNRGMPEEINRIVADHLSDVLFSPTTVGIENLRCEGLASRAILSGDVMYDALLENLCRAENRTDSIAYQWPRGGYALATIHRAENTDNLQKLQSLIKALELIAAEICPVVLALHPRTRKVLDANRLTVERLNIIPPQPYFDLLLLEKRARMILTDSGGVQKEAYFVHVPCVTLREETEWTETLENSCNVLAGSGDPERILTAARQTGSVGPWGSHYGRGDASRIIVEELIRRNPAFNQLAGI